MPTKTATADSGTILTPAASRMLGTPFQARSLRAALRQVVQQRECVSLAAAELRGEVEDSRGFDLDAGEPPNCARGQFGQILSQKRAVEESCGS